jgi:chorismate mutase
MARVSRWVVFLLALALGAGAGPDGVLRVGTSGDYAPFSFEGEGFDVEVAEALARDLGRRIEWVRFDWATLAADAAAGRFDIAMSGVTWLPERAVHGYLTRAVAAGGPCLLGAPAPARIGVNRGGALERWARAAYPRAELVRVDRNRGLPELLTRGRVDAIATDRFELPHFEREIGGRSDRWPAHCEPARDRKVYWVTQSAPAKLGPHVDAWLAAHEDELRRLRERHFGAPGPRDEVDHLIDLLARRFALMPHVAAAKRARGAELQDPAREARVLRESEDLAREHGLDPAGVRALFSLLIELAIQIQARTPPGATTGLDLERELRPELDLLGARIVSALAAAAPLAASALEAGRAAPLEPELEPGELDRLRSALQAVRTRSSPEPPRSG